MSNEEMILGFLAEGGDSFISGSALSDKLGLSRTAVWKHVETLRKRGYRIDAQPSLGYRLVEVPDRLTELELSPLLSTRDIGCTLHVFDSLPSTNSHAFELARDGALHGEAVIAEQQTQGRGRRGRTWVSPPNKNLYLSVILRPNIEPARAPELTLVTAVALAETIRDAGARAFIKWPNDVLIDGQKVAGILTELSADTERVHFVVIGVGVNLNLEANDFPAELKGLATSLQLARGQHVPRALFTAALMTRLEACLYRWAEEGFEPVRQMWKSLSSTIGSDVVVRSETSEIRGRAEDIDASGALLIRQGATLERVLAGDVEHLRPALA